MNTITKFAVTGALSVGIALGFSSVAKADHKVVSGDTLSKIATQYGTTLDAVVQANPQIENINSIYVGDVIFGVGNGTYAQPAKTNAVSSYSAPQSTQYVAPAKTTQSQSTYVAPKKATSRSTYVAPKQSTQPSAEGNSAKAWIAMKESTNNYNAVSASGTYVGKYQLTRSYLNGDTSPANQERVAEKYVKERYGSWEKAKAFHIQNGWY